MAGKAIYGDDFIGQGFSIGAAYLSPAYLAAGFFVKAAGGDDYGTGRYTVDIWGIQYLLGA